MEQEIKEPVCLRCSQCCFYIYPPTNELRKCKHLIRSHMTGKAICRVWKKRNKTLTRGSAIVIDRFLDTEINRKKAIICTHRIYGVYDYPNCEFNTGRKVAPWLKEMKK